MGEASAISCVAHLRRLMEGHGVRTELREGIVFVPEVERWVNLVMYRTASGSWAMEVRATVVDDQVLVDTWASLGDTPETALQDGLQSFCRCGFHMLLAALWGVLETDQVEHEMRRVQDQTWDLCMGPYTTRVSGDTPPLRAPSGFVDRVLAALDASLAGAEAHLLRIYVAVVHGTVTTEVTLDGSDHEGLRRVVVEAGWAFPRHGFASLRWLVAARRQGEQAAHTVERNCGAP